jgi:hypothetical protein
VSGPRPTQRALRPPPRAILDLPLEGRPRLRVVAETFEDERRMLAWLTSSGPGWLIREALAQLGDGPEEAA